jgi:hypothetical protein
MPAIEPALTRGGLLESALGRRAAAVNEHPPRSSYRLEEPLDGRPWRLLLLFEGEPLTQVVLSVADPPFGSSWADVSEEKELARRDAHDRCLRSTLGRATRRQGPLWVVWEYDWGTVESGYAPQTPESAIVVSYHRGK